MLKFSYDPARSGWICGNFLYASSYGVIDRMVPFLAEDILRFSNDLVRFGWICGNFL
jgi:hypothetical protein